jgi:hypothetical protein
MRLVLVADFAARLLVDDIAIEFHHSDTAQDTAPTVAVAGIAKLGGKMLNKGLILLSHSGGSISPRSNNLEAVLSNLFNLLLPKLVFLSNLPAETRLSEQSTCRDPFLSLNSIQLVKSIYCAVYRLV